MTVKEAHALGVKSLLKSPSPALDVDCLLQHILQCDKTSLLFHNERVLTQEEQFAFLKAIEIRNTGFPIAYITGHKEFYGIEFLVTQDVLIPKPDTETLVEKAIEVLKEKSNSNNILTICDMCTGSGCVALSIMSECLTQKIFTVENLPSFTLVDISDKALEVAQKNAVKIISQLTDSKQKQNLLQRKLRFTRSNLFETVTGSFDLITSNPPYIPEKEALELLNDGRREPLLALDGDVEITGSPSYTKDGLAVMRNLVPQAKLHLAPNGYLLVEAGEYNAEDTQIIFLKSYLKHTKIFCDLEGQMRVVKGQNSTAVRETFDDREFCL